MSLRNKTSVAATTTTTRTTKGSIGRIGRRRRRRGPQRRTGSVVIVVIENNESVANQYLCFLHDNENYHGSRDDDTTNVGVRRSLRLFVVCCLMMGSIDRSIESCIYEYQMMCVDSNDGSHQVPRLATVALSWWLLCSSCCSFRSHCCRQTYIFGYCYKRL